MPEPVAGRAADTADLPGPDASSDIVARKDNGDDQRGEGDRGRGAGKGELQRRRTTAPQRAYRVDEDRRAARADNGNPDIGLRGADIEPGHADDDGQRSA